MRFPSPLVPARLVRRYKRFLADVELEGTGELTVAHCPNPGAMLGLAEPGTRVWLEPNDDPRKKLKFGWRLVELPGGHLAGIDTGVPNRVVSEALAAGAISELAAWDNVRPEVRYAEKSRIDFLLSGAGKPDVYVEVKNVHLRRESDLAEFPDCVTARGARHLDDLAAMVGEGHRAVMVYLVQRTDCGRFDLARDLDPAYGAAFDRARKAGVEAICYGTEITRGGVEIGAPIPLMV
ncbi:DNA/RNA nuclease SfsA [Boseongicola aestuarii]|uniref:Sugar fermentation stimulation protein homolog n=1 Tax=Boseongicola aestuarii TaxID=1470561 RepID=A0A238IYU8_9RHOB|nr:DNA/RNA nuclease SfsA [Boseongicola aestuarii]SMX23587.1 Sugar fermentation stimulation protein A [Boseongicola aestuarii]